MFSQKRVTLASILTDYVSLGDLLVGGVGDGKEEGREKEDGREDGGGNASWKGCGGEVPRGSPGLPRPSSLCSARGRGTGAVAGRQGIGTPAAWDKYDTNFLISSSALPCIRM